jgi:quinone-modifying oxidoreductase, subunit QmoB
LSPYTLIIGDGPCAQRIETGLAALDLPARQVSPDDILACRGTVGDFAVRMNQNGGKVTETAAAVVIAAEDRREPNFAPYGLTPAPSVVSLSDWRPPRFPNSLETSEVSPETGPIVFILSLLTENLPTVAREVMTAARSAATPRRGRSVYILTRHLKVAGDGLEALYHQCREAGVGFVKLFAEPPEIQQTGEAVEITFLDDMTGERFRLRPALTVVDETIRPNRSLRRLAEIFRLRRGPDGFIQTDNVHRISVDTHRVGILAAGPARCPQSPADHLMDADDAVLRIQTRMTETGDRPATVAEIERYACVRCFTCYRLCPYGAVLVHPTRMEAVAAACQGCGLCAAECPREAIAFPDPALAGLPDRIASARKTASGNGPLLVAFCCSRSAAQALETAKAEGETFPEGLLTVTVPCAGAVSATAILNAFTAGADGVALMTCHPGNCHAETGNLHALARADEIRRIMTDADIAPERLLSATLAANMPAECVRYLADFEGTVAGRRAGGSS